jgi:hypothetical protein
LSSDWLRFLFLPRNFSLKKYSRQQLSSNLSGEYRVTTVKQLFLHFFQRLSWRIPEANHGDFWIKSSTCFDNNVFLKEYRWFHSDIIKKLRLTDSSALPSSFFIECLPNYL